MKSLQAIEPFDAAIPPAEVDIAIFKRKWQAARRPGQPLPPYEEITVGSLGRLANHMALIGGELGTFKILRAGNSMRTWLGSEAADTFVADLPPDCAGPLNEVLVRALHSGEPVTSRAHRVRDGLVQTYEILALPLACRWGGTLIAAYVREHDTRYNLVGTIFRSTKDAILALATIRDPAGTAADFRIVACNAGAARLARATEADLLWRRLSELALAGQENDVRDRLLESLAGGGHDQFELTLPFDDGELHLKVSVAAAGDLLSATFTDISDVKRREASFRLMFESNPVPMWVYDPETLKISRVNDAAIAHYGYDRDRFQGMTLFDIWPVDEHAVHSETARSFADPYRSDRTWRHVKADGSEIEVLTYGRRLTVQGRPSVLVAIVDVTERKRAEARIAYMAHHDALTGLPNRSQFTERLDEALAQFHRKGGSIAVHCIDLDQFKRVNDTLGHPFGDQLLQRVAERLERCVGEGHSIARFGGDEFAIMQAPIDNPTAASELAGRVIAKLNQPYVIEGHEVIIGASIGIALAPSDGTTTDVLLRNADMALYRAKAQGRGTWHCFEPEMDRRLQARRTLELDLRKALARGEFELFYQPIINLRTNEVSGFEALTRWHHPERGMVSPAEFIPIAEELGLIVPLGEWALREACRCAATWPKDVRVAVNLSPVQFRSRGVVQAVLSALGYSGLAPARLELEITESVLLGETEANIATLHQLRGLGVRISMDDFGTGYSSLSYLRSFPFDKIKIDRSFVREMGDRPDCVAIVRAVAGLGASLGIATTAEGVETCEQLEHVRAEGCTEVQGYLFSRPQPAGQIARLLSGSLHQAVA